MRLPLTTLEIFDAIAREGTFKGAAARLGLQPSTVSHQLKTLETQLGAALIIRTTRSLSLTEAGRALLRGARPAFDQLADAVESAKSTGHEARGSLRLTAPEAFHHLIIGPVLKSFCAAYPEIEVELSLTDAFTDILSEGLHAGFRLGDRIAQDMVAIRLTRPLRAAVVASPDYLSRHGAPETPRDLLDHACIRYRFASSGRLAAWNFMGEEGRYTVDVKGKLIANTIPVLLDMARRDLGLVYTFRDYCRDEIARGDLLPVLGAHLPPLAGVYIYFPREYRNMAPLRLFVEHLRKEK